jgi:aspartyl-tRNA(Asn)/glutamyl-tRNA(Gln) amidotransferase subunit A
MNLERLDLQEALDCYQRRETRPSELIETFLKAIQGRNPELGAYLEVRPEEVLRRAKELDGRSQDIAKLPLYGIPVAIKDNFLVKGWKATAGSKILADYVSPYTATSVERLEAAGAIVIGKTNCDEFAMGSSNENSAFGNCQNPWDATRVPGGSSGGSAAAVSAHLALGGLGTDTGGSIRQPASLCGIVGLKPTYGRVSRYGVVAFSSSLDQVGPFSHTVWGTARQLEVMGGYDRKDATSSRSVVSRYTDELKETSVRNVTIGVAKAWLEGANPEVVASFQETLKLLEREGAKLVDISLPHVKYALSTYYLIAPSEASSNLARYDGVHYGHRTKAPRNGDELYAGSRGEGFGPEVKLRIMVGTYALSSGYYDAYYIKANQVRRLIQQDFEEAFTKCQCIASPTSPTTAFKIGERSNDPLTMYLSDVYTLPVNLAGLPAISVPCGLDSSRLPIGLQLIGKHFDESTLFKVAHHYERSRGAFANPPLSGGAKS